MVSNQDSQGKRRSDMTERKRDSMLHRSLSWSYLFLISLSLFLTALSLLFAIVYRIEWLDAYVADIATGIIGSLIIIFFVDKIIQRNRDRERLQIVKTAFQRLRIPLMWQMMLLTNIFKASAQSKPSPLPTTYNAVFSDDYYTEIGYLDFSKEAPVATKVDWFSYMDSQTGHFKQKLEQIMDTYAIFLDAELIDILQRITETNFLYFLPQARMIPQIDKQQSFKRYYNVLAGVKEIVKEYVSLMLQLLEYYNAKSDLPITLNPDAWRDDVAPRWGSSRVTEYSDYWQEKKE